MLLALLLTAALPSQNRLESALLDSIHSACPGQNVALDPDLTRACTAWVAAVRSGKAQPTGSALSFYASLESAEPAPLAGFGRVRPASRAESAVAQLFPGTCHFNRAGVAAVLVADDEAVVCALTAQHETDLAHIPGRVEEFDTVAVTGRLAAGLARPRLFVTKPSGEVEELGLIASGGEFSTRVALRETGEHSLEVLADGPGGPQVVALRRVFVGTKPPQSPPVETKIGEGLNGVEAAIAHLRAARGLPKLIRDPKLDAIAEGHSREMARTRTFAHVLPSDGSMSDRLRAAQYPYKSAGENIGFAEDAATAHEAIVSSPAHLANLLDPRHRRIGLGEASGQAPEGGDGVYLTEVLASPVVASDDPAREVSRVVEGERRKHRIPGMERDAALDALAREEAARAAKSGETRLSRDSAGLALEKVPELHGAVTELYVGGSPEMVATSKNLAEPRWTRLGVGAIYANSKSYGAGSLWVVLLFGR